MSLNFDLLSIAEATSIKRGADFFNAVTISLVNTFKVKYAFISKILPPSYDKMQTMALVADGKFSENISYDLKDTPCSHVYDNQVCFYPQDICTLFPEDYLLVEMSAESYLGTPIYSPEGIPLGILVLIDDKPMSPNEDLIHIMQIYSNRIGAELERSEYEKRLIENNRTLNDQNDILQQYAYVTSHNLRSPIANLIGLIDQLDNTNLNELNNTILNYMKNSVEKLNDTVKDLNLLLDFKADNNELKLDEEIHLNILIDRIKQNLNNLEYVEWIIKNETEIFYLNKAYLQSIISNLIDNSIKYKKNGIKLMIEINATLKDNSLSIIIKDNGIGMELDKIGTKLFMPFQRFTTQGKGKGLGLHLVQTQIKSLGGTIEVESKIDIGSIFKIKIPII